LRAVRLLVLLGFAIGAAVPIAVFSVCCAVPAAAEMVSRATPILATALLRSFHLRARIAQMCRATALNGSLEMRCFGFRLGGVAGTGYRCWLPRSSWPLDVRRRLVSARSDWSLQPRSLVVLSCGVFSLGLWRYP
jgi:hypothetical protein